MKYKMRRKGLRRGLKKAVLLGTAILGLAYPSAVGAADNTSFQRMKKDDPKIERLEYSLSSVIDDMDIVHSIIEVCDPSTDVWGIVFPEYDTPDLTVQFLSASLPRGIEVYRFDNPFKKEDDGTPYAWVCVYSPNKVGSEVLRGLIPRVNSLEERIEKSHDKHKVLLQTLLLNAKADVFRGINMLKNGDPKHVSLLCAQALTTIKYLEWYFAKYRSVPRFSISQVRFSTTVLNNTYSYADAYFDFGSVDAGIGVEWTDGPEKPREFGGRVTISYDLTEHWSFATSAIIDPERFSFKRLDLDVYYYAFDQSSYLKFSYLRFGIMYHNLPTEVIHARIGYMFRPSHNWAWFLTLYNTDDPNGPSTDNPDTEKLEYHWKLGVGVIYYFGSGDE
ncbi:hypothetical protein J7K41_00720 [Candidatus Micrarchaeota archaeon]|nr:hypothetical protein [Candidatus Micrarchaeota archaeon]